MFDEKFTNIFWTYGVWCLWQIRDWTLSIQYGIVGMFTNESSKQTVLEYCVCAWQTLMEHCMNIAVRC